jgi:hypothetical protein
MPSFFATSNACSNFSVEIVAEVFDLVLRHARNVKGSQTLGNACLPHPALSSDAAFPFALAALEYVVCERIERFVAHARAGVIRSVLRQ